jgi:hypothetical protein
VVDSDEQTLSVLETLEKCRAMLRDCGREDTAEMVSVVILDLRMRLNQIDEAELKLLCERMIESEVSGEDGEGRPAPRRHPLLRVVK